MYGMHFDFSRRMYEEFKMLAVEDAAAGYRYDVETLFNLFSESQLCFPLFLFCLVCLYLNDSNINQQYAREISNAP